MKWGVEVGYLLGDPAAIRRVAQHPVFGPALRKPPAAVTSAAPPLPPRSREERQGPDRFTWSRDDVTLSGLDPQRDAATLRAIAAWKARRSP